MPRSGLYAFERWRSATEVVVLRAVVDLATTRSARGEHGVQVTAEQVSRRCGLPAATVDRALKRWSSAQGETAPLHRHTSYSLRPTHADAVRRILIEQE